MKIVENEREDSEITPPKNKHWLKEKKRDWLVLLIQCDQFKIDYLSGLWGAVKLCHTSNQICYVSCGIKAYLAVLREIERNRDVR